MYFLPGCPAGPGAHRGVLYGRDTETVIYRVELILLRYTVLWTVLIHRFDLGHLSCVHCYGNILQSGCVVVL